MNLLCDCARSHFQQEEGSTRHLLCMSCREYWWTSMWCQNGRTLLGCSHFKQDKIIQSWLWLDPRSHHRRLFWLNRNVKLGLCESSLILRLGPCPGCLCAQLKQRGSGALRQIFIHFNIHSFQDLKWWNEINASGVNDFIEIDLRIVRTRNSMSHSCCVGYYL